MQSIVRSQRLFVLSCGVRYHHRLGATLSDGRLMVSALRQLGFQISHHTNVTKEELIQHLTNLMEPRNVYDLAVVCFVYCGHWEDDCFSDTRQEQDNFKTSSDGDSQYNV